MNLPQSDFHNPHEQNLGLPTTVGLPEITEAQIAEYDQQEWFKIVCQMRQHNRELMATIKKLQSEQINLQKELNFYQQRSQNFDCLLSQQTEDLEVTSRKVAQLSRQLQIYHQKNQDKKQEIANLTQKLQTTQAYLGQLEQDCAALKAENQTLESEIQAISLEKGELTSRLERQQRYTMQYKSALRQAMIQPSFKINSLNKDNLPVSPALPEIKPWLKEQNKDNNLENGDYSLGRAKISALASAENSSEPEAESILTTETANIENIFTLEMLKSEETEAESIESSQEIEQDSQKNSQSGVNSTDITTLTQPEKEPKIKLPKFAKRNSTPPGNQDSE